MATDQPIFNVPPVTKVLLGANAAVYLVMLLLPARLEQKAPVFFAFAPARYVTIDWNSLPGLLSPLTYQFLHGGVAHLVINMLGLAAFGSGVERNIGPWRMLGLYLLAGVVGAFAQFAAHPESAQLLVGASGSISGLFAGVLWFAARRRGFLLLVGLWMVMNVVTGEFGLLAEGGVPVAWIAHLGGFLTGLFLFPLLEQRGRREPRR
jgi:membrane associated rhomboid family serine protease